MSDFSYRLTRTIAAPVDTVWQAWTIADQYQQWSYAEAGSVHLDVRVGGEWSAAIVDPEGNRTELGGTYLEVQPKERLVLSMQTPMGETAMELDLTDKGQSTEVVLSQNCGSAEERDMAEQGSTMLLDSLTAFLAGRA
ncbi:SRPBCC domain-containing protein [Nocardia sp. XZ_19_385]|uniref:SRPBCC family protein n=1 Tax=Nocardia sp. XZ_19_385 TaxID=2769488 RepID=UPI001E2F644A|nr:SRPBCC domain-containing protein [Nocardia sp. XZ_19_385]